MSSREDKEPSLYQLTKKERVIYLAQKDPFLKVEKIAQLAETTSHYVRTVLSEANLSLTKLRENYARKNKVVSNNQKELILDILNLEDIKNIEYKSQQKLILNKEYQFDDRSTHDLKETLLFMSDKQSLFVSSLFLSSNHNLDNSKQLKNLKKLSVSSIKVTVDNPNPKLAKLLNTNSSIVTLEKEIYLGDKFKGINVVYFSTTALKLVLNDELKEIKFIKR